MKSLSRRPFQQWLSRPRLSEISKSGPALDNNDTLPMDQEVCEAAMSAAAEKESMPLEDPLVPIPVARF